MKTFLTTAFAVGWLGACSALASDSPQSAQWQSTLAGVPAPELPFKAAGLIKTAKSSERGFTTAQVVKAALALNPSAATAAVGAIARAIPDMAATAAGTAAQEQPERAVAIAKAAAAAAPAKAGKIVTAVCRAVPNAYYAVTMAAVEAAPGYEKEILRALASVYPELKPGIERALAGQALGPSAVAGALISARPTVAVTSDSGVAGNTTSVGAGPVAGTPVLPRGPSIAPPFVPLSSTVSNVTPATSGNVPRGGRNYAAP